jgi:FkbM family methyltransferase
MVIAFKFYILPLHDIVDGLLLFEKTYYSSTTLFSNETIVAPSPLEKSHDNHTPLTSKTTTTTPSSMDDNNKKISSSRPESCTAQQMERIYQRLPDYDDFCRTGKQPWLNNCPISIITGCPETTWLDEYYASMSFSTMDRKFLAINVGCNKGYDAIHFLKMGTLNPIFSKKTWSEAMPKDAMGPNCNQNVESDILSSANVSPTDANEVHDSILVYCIEPMPSTFLALYNASNITGWGENLKVIHAAINNEEPSSLLFPKPSIDNLGYEKHTIGTGCSEIDEGCVPVETKRLDDLMRDENLQGQRVQILLIDVEGYDFEVLLGGNATLQNTEYVEFEFNWRGKVRV